MLVHAALRIGDALVTLCDAMPTHGFVAPDRDAPVTAFITLYVEDADALHARALAAGATRSTRSTRPRPRRPRRLGARPVRPPLGDRDAHRGRLRGGDRAAHGGVRVTARRRRSRSPAGTQAPTTRPPRGRRSTRATVRKTFAGALEGESVAELLTCGELAYIANERVTRHARRPRAGRSCSSTAPGRAASGASSCPARAPASWPACAATRGWTHGRIALDYELG